MLEIVITGRHDDYGGADFLDRLGAAAEHNHRLLDAIGVAHTFTLVEWNPVADRVTLSELVRARLSWWGSCIVVDREWHRALSTNPRLQFMEFFGKNAAIRRSSADAILTTNSDVFLSADLVRTLKSATLDDRTVYRATRVDIDRNAPWRNGESVFANTAHQVRVNDLQPPDYGNSAGDFLLLTRNAWMKVGGFNERVRYAKIHKDGQFCFNAWHRGLRFETLGRIYHIDHDGSYANAGALRGSPDAHYGPEWDYRQPYRNAASWGLTAAIDTHADGITRVHHPSTHGSGLSVITIESGQDVALTVNAALTVARTQFVVITTDPTLAAFGGRAALGEMLAHTDAGLIVPAGALIQDALLGPVPAVGAPIVVRRDVIDSLIDWDDTEADPLLAFWLRAIERVSAAEMPRAGLVWAGVAPAIRAGLASTVLRRRDANPDTNIEAMTVRDHLASTRETRDLVGDWVARTVPEGESCAIVGPDWATARLLEAVHATNRDCVGIFTPIAAEEGTSRWGLRLQPLAALRNTNVTRVLAGVALHERLAAHRCDARLAVFGEGIAHETAAEAELDFLRRAQARDVAANRADAVIDRLSLFSALEGQMRWTHTYDAAQVCERVGRRADAARLYRDVMVGCHADVALRMRATFHVGRLLAEAGQHEQAESLLAAVLRHNPAHRAARQLLDMAVAR